MELSYVFAGFALGTAALLFRALVAGWSRVPEGFVGVRLKLGAPVKNPGGHGLALVAPGLHFHPPWEQLIPTSLMERTLNLSPKNKPLVALAADATPLQIRARARYHLLPEKIEKLLFGIRNPERHLEGLLRGLLRANIATFEVNSGANAEVLHKRIRDAWRVEMAPELGVELASLDVLDLTPPDELADALNSVFLARNRAETHFAAAQSSCEQRILAARAGTAIAAKHAQATAAEIPVFAAVLQRLSDRKVLASVMERRRAEVYGRSKSTILRRPR